MLVPPMSQDDAPGVETWLMIFSTMSTTKNNAASV